MVSLCQMHTLSLKQLLMTAGHDNWVVFKSDSEAELKIPPAAPASHEMTLSHSLVSVTLSCFAFWG